MCIKLCIKFKQAIVYNGYYHNFFKKRRRAGEQELSHVSFQAHSNVGMVKGFGRMKITLMQKHHVSVETNIGEINIVERG